MVKIDDSAKERLLHLLSESKENCYVRVGVKSGGCSGLSYELEFDNKKNDDDELVENNSISLLINKNGSRRLLNPKSVRKVSNTAITII